MITFLLLNNCIFHFAKEKTEDFRDRVTSGGDSSVTN